MSIIRDGCPQAKKTSADRGYQTVEQPSTLHLSSTDSDNGGLVGGELSAPLQLLVFFLLLLLHRKSLLLCVPEQRSEQGWKGDSFTHASEQALADHPPC